MPSLPQTTLCPNCALPTSAPPNPHIPPFEDRFTCYHCLESFQFENPNGNIKIWRCGLCLTRNKFHMGELPDGVVVLTGGNEEAVCGGCGSWKEESGWCEEGIEKGLLEEGLI